jgi:hypothetical protein
MNQINVSSFVEDEIDARTVEEEVLKLIQKKYPQSFKEDGNHKEYDLYIPEIKKSVEIKWDKKSDSTGNYFIETALNEKPSGLEATTADWWIFVDRESYCFIPTTSLRYLLKSTYCFKRSLTGEDGAKVEYKLIRKDTLSSYPYVTFLKRSKML